jgi:hypothetical protein
MTKGSVSFSIVVIAVIATSCACLIGGEWPGIFVGVFSLVLGLSGLALNWALERNVEHHYGSQ